LLSGAGLEQQQHYGYFCSVPLSRAALKHCTVTETQTPQEHAPRGAAGVDSAQRENITMRRTTAMPATGMGVVQESSVQLS